MTKRKIFYADKVSGTDGVVFTLSVIPQVIASCNQRVNFEFNFWGALLDTSQEHGTEWARENKFIEESEKILKFIQKPDGLLYFENIKNQVITETNILYELANQIRLEMTDLNDNQLINCYYKFIKQYINFFGLGAITFVYESVLSSKLMSSLSNRYSNAASYLGSLLQGEYRSFMLESELFLKKIDVSDKSLKNRLMKQYIKEFFYIDASYHSAPIVDKKYIKQRITSVKSPVENQIAAELKNQKIKKIRLLIWEKKLVELLKINEVIRDQRKKLNLIGNYLMFRFFEEASTRNKIKISILRRSLWFEYKNIFSDKNNLISKLEKRKKMSLIFDITSNQQFYLEYPALKDKINLLKNKNQLQGTSAAAGIYAGKVKKIMGRSDFFAFKSGDILVTTMTRPDFLPIMRQAGAIITEEGGLTCHAAIIARELKIPCIVGIRNLTSILHNNQKVLVDANQGIVSIKNKE